MKIFQIFSHPFPPCEPYFGFMQRARDWSEEYTLIAPSNFMGRDFVPIHSLWESLPEYLRSNTNGPRMEFDAMRVKYLSEHFDHVYIDIDVDLHAPISMLKAPQCSGPGVMIGNGNPEDGARAWENYLRACPKFCRPASLAFSGMNPAPVPDHLFTHHYAKGAYF